MENKKPKENSGVGLITALLNIVGGVFILAAVGGFILGLMAGYGIFSVYTFRAIVLGGIGYAIISAMIAINNKVDKNYEKKITTYASTCPKCKRAEAISLIILNVKHDYDSSEKTHDYGAYKGGKTTETKSHTTIAKVREKCKFCSYQTAEFELKKTNIYIKETDRDGVHISGVDSYPDVNRIWMDTKN